MSVIECVCCRFRLVDLFDSSSSRRSRGSQNGMLRESLHRIYLHIYICTYIHLHVCILCHTMANHITIQVYTITTWDTMGGSQNGVTPKSSKLHHLVLKPVVWGVPRSMKPPYTCIYIYIHVHRYTIIYIYYMFTYTYTHIYIYIYLFTCMYVLSFAYTYKCTQVRMYIYIYRYTYVCPTIFRIFFAYFLRGWDRRLFPAGGTEETVVLLRHLDPARLVRHHLIHSLQLFTTTFHSCMDVQNIFQDLIWLVVTGA